MKNNTALTAKTFLKMAEADRKLIVIANVLSTVLTVSVIVKLFISAICFINSEK
ncbi:MAG: hypothetical protein IIX16_04835 [Clostridia bacterium]|nr:hypothetical protein [Clostridia bacterium]